MIPKHPRKLNFFFQFYPQVRVTLRWLHLTKMVASYFFYPILCQEIKNPYHQLFDYALGFYLEFVSQRNKKLSEKFCIKKLNKRLVGHSTCTLPNWVQTPASHKAL